MANQAFIDGQNLYLGTTHAKDPWRVDLNRFRVYLKEKYNVDKAYYFIGAVNDDRDKLYKVIQEAGFILMFREHNSSMIGKKKGNVDTDIVFTIMEKIAERERFDKIILVSGDGDYIKMVKYLIEKNKLAKVLAPNHKAFSSLYKNTVNNTYYSFLDNGATKRKIKSDKV
jgi:uncharacterized LabA/DUF88 family protein